jgi:thiol:disulfide interchange protein
VGKAGAAQSCRGADRRFRLTASARRGPEIALKKAAAAPHAAPGSLHGVLVLHGKDGVNMPSRSPPLPPRRRRRKVAWWQTLLLAFLGRVVLNAMPCVFPILS